MFRGDAGLPPEVEVVVCPGEDALHRMRRRVPSRCDAGLEARTTEVVVVADQTFEATSPEVSLEARVARNTFVSRHDVMMKHETRDN